MPTEEIDPEEVATALRSSLSLIYRWLKQPRDEGLTLPERGALARLDRSGPMTAAELARQEQISPQSLGVTLAGLEQQGLVGRAPDPTDGRRIILSITAAGDAEMTSKRAARTAEMARALRTEYTQEELALLLASAPLLERLVQLD